MNKMNRNTNISKTMHCIVIMITMILLGQDIYFFLLRNEESNLKEFKLHDTDIIFSYGYEKFFIYFFK